MSGAAGGRRRAATGTVAGRAGRSDANAAAPRRPARRRARGRRHLVRRVRRRPDARPPLIVAASGAEDVDDVAIPTLFAGVAATWIAYLAGMWAASRRSGTRRLRRGLPRALPRRRPRRRPDRRAHPARRSSRSSTCRCASCGPTRSPTTGCRRTPRSWSTGPSGATMRAARADGLRRRADRRGARLPRAAAGLVRRPLQPRRGVAGRRRPGSPSIHFRPVEYPGLFVFGLVVGACLLVTRRLGHVDRHPRRVQRRPGCCSRCGDRRSGRPGWHHCRSR